jgi:LysM repeat protein
VRESVSRICIVVLSILLASCGGDAGGNTSLVTSTLKPYRPTSSPTVQPSVTALASQAPLGPTPTPLIHVVKSNETLISIAILYGVDLEDLLLANPGIDPQFLSIGMELIIPGEGGQPVDMLLPTPTPVPLVLSPVRCYPTSSKALWCLLEITNTSSEDVEGLAGSIILMDEAGEVLGQNAAYGPLNRLQVDQRMPLASFFPVSPEGMQTAVAAILSAVPVNDADSRYQEVEVHIQSQTTSPDGLSIRVHGQLETTAGDEETEVRLRLLLIGLDENSDVIGFRIWEPTSTIWLGETTDFDCTMFSFGPRIDDFDVMAEALIIS